MPTPKRKAAPKGAKNRVVAKSKGKPLGGLKPTPKGMPAPWSFRQGWRYFYRSLLGGGMLGALVVFLAFFRYAEERVASRLDGQVWDLPGKIYSGPEDLWPGMKATPEEIAADLSAAGYARVASASQAGDYSVGSDSLRILRKEGSFPGYSVKGGEVVVRFAEGRIASVTGGRAVLPPAMLASVRGPENEDRNPLPLSQIPEVMRQAVLAMEDARFYQHPGVDPVGLLRAVAVNAVAGHMTQGGSSLTQQLAKNLFLSPERSLRRKVEEAFLALALERRLGKEKILQTYLNEIYLGQAAGGSVCGVDAASRAWFGKPIGRVTLGEAATIAGVISAPNAYSPLRHPEAATERRNLALDRMAEVGVISPEAAAKGKAEALVLHPTAAGRQAPWATDAVVEEVEDQLGEGVVARDALRVHTTIHPVLQRAAEKAVEEGLAEVVAAHPKLSGLQAALVVVRPKDGAILAVVGGKDYGDSYYNRALLAERQVGSTVKGLSMLIAFDRDPALGPASRFEDAPLTLTSDGRDWSPKNYDGSYLGPVSIRRAIASSRNIPAVRLAQQVGMENLLEGWKDLGLSGASHYPSAALGSFSATPLQLAAAYATFPSGGVYHAPWLVRAALRENGDSAWDRPESRSARYSARATFLAAEVLRGVMRDGTGKGAAKYGVGEDVGGKSGTTDRYTDAWFAGFSSELAVVVWVGFDQQAETGLTGSQAALPIWARFMSWSGTSEGTVSPPKGVVQAEVCNDTDLPPCGGCSSTRMEWFSAGQVPAADCSILPRILPSPKAPITQGSAPKEEKAVEAPAEGGALRRLGDWLGIKPKR